MEGVGAIGDPIGVPWLIDQMTESTTARLAGAAFEWITGADLRFSDLEVRPATMPPEQVDQVQDPANEDAGLPVPDVFRVKQWWSSRKSDFLAGRRYCLGRQRESEVLIDVLRKGRQRQRARAALAFALTEPNAPYFNVRSYAPAQQKSALSWS